MSRTEVGVSSGLYIDIVFGCGEKEGIKINNQLRVVAWLSTRQPVWLLVATLLVD